MGIVGFSKVWLNFRSALHSGKIILSDAKTGGGILEIIVKFDMQKCWKEALYLKSISKN